MAVAMLTAGCANDDEFVKKGGPVSVELAYALSSQVINQPTRQAAAVITGNDNPRLPLPQSMIIIPNINGNPSFIDYSWVDPVLKPGAGNNPTSMLYRTRYCEIGTGVNGFRIYGGVPQLPPYTKMYNGSLIETFPESFTTVADLESISFNLETIYKSEDYASTNGIPEGAQALADCMTAIATTSGFNTSTDDAIKEIFDRFTNEGNVLPGSAASVKVWIEKFKESIQSTINDVNTAEEIKEILIAVKTAAETQITSIGTITSSSYPRNINLPDGAAVLKWDKNTPKFVPLISTTTIANINSMARFAYPAPLYYYVSSPIMTSEEKVDFATLYSEVTTDDSKTAWDKVLANANFTKTSVTDNTRAVVLTQPVQFAVAQLKVKIKAHTSPLKDADNQNVTIGPECFPLKGIVVCDQRPVDYRFLPKEAAPGVVSDAGVLFIYDNQVEANSYLTTQEAGVWAPGCNTLVLQSLKDEDVNIILEFENNSGSSFKCLDGIVYPGTRFYMIGRVEASQFRFPDENVYEENRNQVFTKDYITTVNMTVSSLAKAYNVPPNLLSPNLEIGVETTPQWEGAKPTATRLA